MLREALAAGAAGLSSSAAPTHLDIAGRPVPSRLAEHSELLALAEELGRHGAGSLAFLPESSIGGLDDTDKELLISLAKACGLPVVIQGLGGRNKVDAPTATWEASKEFLDRAGEQGAGVYSLLITRPFDRAFVVDETNLHYLAVPSWNRMLNLPPGERRAVLSRSGGAGGTARRRRELQPRSRQGHDRSPAAVAQRLRRHESPRRTTRSGRRVRSPTSPTNKASRRPTPCSISRSTRISRVQLRWRTESPEWAAAVREAQLDPRMLIGTSDGGAHLARDDGADWSSYFLGSWVRDRQVWSLEEGHPADHRSARRPGRHLRSRHADRRRLGRHDDLRSRRDRPDAQGVRARPARRGRPLQSLWPRGLRDDRERRAHHHRAASSPATCPGTSSVPAVPPGGEPDGSGGSSRPGARQP